MSSLPICISQLLLSGNPRDLTILTAWSTTIKSSEITSVDEDERNPLIKTLQCEIKILCGSSQLTN